MSAAGVAEWVARKEARAESPLAAARALRAAAREHRQAGAASAVSASSSAVAVCDGVEIARSGRAVVVSRRVWFPPEDCALECFEDSAKRWR